MSKRKYPSELNTRQIRVNIATYLILKELSQKNSITMADAVDLLVAGQDHKAPVEPTQTRLPIEAIALSTPVTTARRRSTPVSISFSREVKNVNGHRQTD